MGKYRVLVKDLRVRAYEVEAPDPESAREQVEEGVVDEGLAEEIFTESDVDTVELVNSGSTKPTS